MKIATSPRLKALGLAVVSGQFGSLIDRSPEDFKVARLSEAGRSRVGDTSNDVELGPETRATIYNSHWMLA